MNFLLDTDTCSEQLRGNRQVYSKAAMHRGQLAISVITLGELYVWALRKNASPRRLPGIAEFVTETRVLHVDERVARQFGELHARLLDLGQP